MKRLVVALGLLSISTTSLALGCDNLGITITNNSGNDCKLRATTMFYGSLYQGTPPASIPSGTRAQTFYLLQDAYGAGVRLDYRCDGKVVIFYSGQNYCSFIAGDIGGSAYEGNDLNLHHQEVVGSYWSSIPGKISWIIY